MSVMPMSPWQLGYATLSHAERLILSMYHGDYLQIFYTRQRSTTTTVRLKNIDKAHGIDSTMF